MNTELREQTKNDFKKDFFKLMSNCFWKGNGKCKKAQRYQASNNKQKKLFSVSLSIMQQNVFQRICQ